MLWLIGNRGMQAHTYQQNVCSAHKGLILNAACKEDPAKLGEKFGAVNLDLLDHDGHTNTDLTRLRNFVQGDVTKLAEIFDPGYFSLIVLGEVLEHCTTAYAHVILDSIYNHLPVGGKLCLTFPLDDRPAKAQHAPHHLKILVGDEENPSFTTWHQHRWLDHELEELLPESKWKVLQKEQLHYGFTANGGWGMLLEKVSGLPVT